MQRYEALRNTMIETNIGSEDELLVDKSHLEEMQQDSYQMAHDKVQSIPDFKIDHFHNEYLDEFIKEVKAYNIKKGNAVYEDTQMNVLQELRASDDVRTPYVEEIEEESYFDSISSQVASLVKEYNEHTEEEIINEENQVEAIDEIQENITHSQNEELLEETRKMSLKIDEYKDNVETINDKVSQTNTILNVIIVILILLILVVIAFAIWYVLLRNNHAI